LAERQSHYLLERLTVRALMTRPVLTIAPHESLAEAVRLMLENRIGGLPVTEGQRGLGLRTEVELLRAFALTRVFDLLRGFSTALGVRAGRPPRAADAPLPVGSSARVILVPLDGSSGSEVILDTIGEIARAEGAAVRT